MGGGHPLPYLPPAYFDFALRHAPDVDPPPPPPTKIPGSAHGSRQLIAMTTVNLGVICNLIFVFLPENIGASARYSVSSCRLSISLQRSIA